LWGYPLENRSYQSDDIDYKFTGKQRDAETGYDYFGARYYDARIANWGSVDPLFEKHIGWNPYNYVLRNPMALIDPDGRQIHFSSNQEEVFYVTRTLDPAIGRLIEITGDLTMLHIAPPKRGMDDNYSNLWGLETSGHKVSFKIVGHYDIFRYAKSPDTKFNPQLTTPAEFESENPGYRFYGYTLVSGVSATPEEPKTCSLTDETRIVISRYYGEKEGVITMADEMTHAYRYISGQKWWHKSNGVLTKEVNEAIDNAKKSAKSNYEMWDK